MHQKIINITRFEDFTEPINQMEHRSWAVRGHGAVGWHIESSLARFFRSHQDIEPGSYYPREADVIRKFRKAACLQLQHYPAENEQLSWLAVMQHFGAPTRLVGFTHSPFVALFFALEDSAPEIRFGERLSPADLEHRYRPYEVHAVHLKSVRSHTEKILGKKTVTEDRDFFIGKGSKQADDFVAFFEGAWQNQRQVAQQGLFMIPSKIDLDIDAFLKSCPSESQLFPDISWFIFRFPGGLNSYYEMATRLLRANVTAEALFPGLEGVARSMAMRYHEPRISLR